MWPSPVPGQHSRGRQRRLPVLLSPEGVRAEPCPPAFALRLVNFSLLHKTQEMLELGASESLHVLLRAVSPTTLSLSDSLVFSARHCEDSPHMRPGGNRHTAGWGQDSVPAPSTRHGFLFILLVTDGSQ